MYIDICIYILLIYNVYYIYDWQTSPVVYFAVRYKAKRSLFSLATEAQGDRNLAVHDPIHSQATMLEVQGIKFKHHWT